MIRSARLRIAAAVLAAITGLLLLQSLVVLDRFEHAMRQALDAHIRDELAEVELILGRPQLQEFVREEAARHSKWDELFFEVRDASDRLVVGSPNLPEGGFPPPVGAKVDSGVKTWEVVHPTSRSGHRRVVVAEATSGAHKVRVGATLKRAQRLYWSLREQLAWLLGGISFVGALVAWWVATHALVPVRHMIDRAKALGSSLEGSLPRSGRRDEIDDLAEVLNALLARIRAEVQRTRRLISHVSHALRTPLTAMRASLEVWLGRSPARDRGRLGDMIVEVDRLTRIVNELLMLEKLDMGTGLDRLRPEDLGSVAQDVVSHLQVLASERGIALHADIVPVQVLGDRPQLQQAIVNLVENGLRVTPEGGNMFVRVQADAAHARVIVSDSGPGFSSEAREHALEPFFSLPGEGTGVGLGLPIAQAIARAHGGDLRIGHPPAGAELTIELPRAPDGLQAIPGDQA